MYFCNLFSKHSLLMEMIIFSKHELSVFQNSFSIYLVRRVKFALCAQRSHLLESFFDLSIKFCLFRCLFSFFVDRFDDTDVIFVKVVGKHRIRIREVISCIFEGFMLAYYFHFSQIL